MRPFLTLVLAAVLGSAGCQSIFPSTPGFQFGWQVTIPPTVNNSSVLHPVPAAPTTAYLYEGQTPLPVVQRYYSQPSAPAGPPIPPPPPAARMAPVPEQIPLPKAPPSCGSPISSQE